MGGLRGCAELRELREQHASAVASTQQQCTTSTLSPPLAARYQPYSALSPALASQRAPCRAFSPLMHVLTWGGCVRVCARVCNAAHGRARRREGDAGR
eukprot:2946855-Rhodomonas_salina.2